MFFYDSSTKIYHYTSLDAFIKFILPEKRLRFSKFGQSRDPYEFLPHDFEFELYPHWQEDYTIANKHDFEKKLLGLNEYWVNSQFLSFVLAAPLESAGFKKPRMWDQYGNKHDGVCLEFSYAQIRKGFDNLDCPYKFQGKIDYDEDLNPYFIFQDLSLLMHDLSNPNYLQTSFKNFFFHKDVDYSQEREYRFLILNKDTNKTDYLDISGSLTKIIFGSGVSITTQDFYKPIFMNVFPGISVEAISWTNGVADSSDILF